MADELNPPSKIRIAIVGGGCASLSAAFDLSEAHLRDRYEITVYQMGWRLGGKGASGRGKFDRIEEHGLHVWMGFYENAFRLMREVYASLPTGPTGEGGRGWRDAFIPADHVGLAHWQPKSNWQIWSALFPPMPGIPGDSSTSGSTARSQPSCTMELFARGLRSFWTLFQSSLPASRRIELPTPAVDAAWSLAQAQQLLRRLRGLNQRGGVGGGMKELAAVVAGLAHCAQLAQLRMIGAWRELFQLTLEELRRRLPPGADHGLTFEQQRCLEVADVIVSALRGILLDRISWVPGGFDRIDHLEFRAWLRQHGARASTLNSPFVRGLYTLMFAFEDGDMQRPRISAAVGLRVCTRMFLGYRGNFFWKMRGGMGDVVFAPLYRSLRRRGVRFRFFHALKHVSLAPAGEGAVRRVSALHFQVQAKTATGRPYRPLVRVHGLSCWPSEPLWDQLERGSDLRHAGQNLEHPGVVAGSENIELLVGRDFDHVILGVGVAELPHVASELLDAQPRWLEMTRRVKTVATQALQLWLRPDMRALGWDRGPTTLTAFHHPFDTWADMTHLVSEESWPKGREPGAIAYFCNVLDDKGLSHEEAQVRVRAHAIEFLEGRIAKIWPQSASANGAFHWSVLLDAESGHRSTPENSMIDRQYYRANTTRSERYTLALPGLAEVRISPLDSSFSNLTVTGDWTACRLNVGCVEAAVISGRLAAHAIVGSPRLHEIIGYNDP